MNSQKELERYSVITEKNPREIVLLRGNGCRWRRCTFCDYHLDYSRSEEENYQLNQRELNKVSGRFHCLEVINSGSFCDLNARTMALIEQICLDRAIRQLHFECHWIHREEIPAIRRRFARKGIAVKIKSGIETFDYDFRENILKKGIDESDPAVICAPFDEICLLFGLTGQTADSMTRDIETGLALNERVCVNIMTENTTAIRPDPDVIALFVRELYPLYRDHPRVDILMENTDFGVGGAQFSAITPAPEYREAP